MIWIGQHRKTAPLDHLPGVEVVELVGPLHITCWPQAHCRGSLVLLRVRGVIIFGHLTIRAKTSSRMIFVVELQVQDYLSWQQLPRYSLRRQNCVIPHDKKFDQGFDDGIREVNDSNLPEV